MTSPTPQAPAREAVELPPLPDSDYTLTEQIGVLDKVEAHTFPVFTHQSMWEYARSALAAQQEEVDKMREELDLLKTNDYFAICDAHKAMNLTLTLTGPVDANGKMCPLCCRRAATVRPSQGEK